MVALVVTAVPEISELLIEEYNPNHISNNIRAKMVWEVFSRSRRHRKSNLMRGQETG